MDDDDAKIPEHYAAEVARFFLAHDRWLFGHACLRTRDRELAADMVVASFDAVFTADGTDIESGTNWGRRLWLAGGPGLTSH